MSAAVLHTCANRRPVRRARPGAHLWGATRRLVLPGGCLAQRKSLRVAWVCRNAPSTPKFEIGQPTRQTSAALRDPRPFRLQIKYGCEGRIIFTRFSRPHTRIGALADRGQRSELADRLAARQGRLPTATQRCFGIRVTPYSSPARYRGAGAPRSAAQTVERRRSVVHDPRRSSPPARPPANPGRGRIQLDRQLTQQIAQCASGAAQQRRRPPNRHGRHEQRAPGAVPGSGWHPCLRRALAGTQPGLHDQHLL